MSKCQSNLSYLNLSKKILRHFWSKYSDMEFLRHQGSRKLVPGVVIFQKTRKFMYFICMLDVFFIKETSANGRVFSPVFAFYCQQVKCTYEINITQTTETCQWKVTDLDVSPQSSGTAASSSPSPNTRKLID